MRFPYLKTPDDFDSYTDFLGYINSGEWHRRKDEFQTATEFEQYCIELEALAERMHAVGRGATSGAEAISAFVCEPRLPRDEEPPSLKELLVIRKEAATRLDPRKAEVTFWWCDTCDPYGDYPRDGSPYCVGRQYFVCMPGENMWIWEGDLPEPRREELWRLIDSGKKTVV